ncbi:MAG: proline--tRNA ligase [Caldisericaceae bacterium]
MRLTNFFLPTLREEPQDAEIESHKLMLKASLIRKVAAGVYSYLPLGLMALKKVEDIIRDEMNKAGAIELLFPAIMPRELWEETGRWAIYGDEMFRLKDRKSREFCLGPTHEEAVVDLARNEMRSYKELPKTFYQIQTKYRDEIRPRFGLIRAREFVMKDAYSFDESEEALEKSYSKMYEAYTNIFRRCGLTTTPIEADSGAIGGKVSHEFVVESEMGGESAYVFCPKCHYASNVEAAKSSTADSVDTEDEKEMSKVETFDNKTIEQVSTFLKISKNKTVKSLVYKADEEFVLALVRGDDDLNEIKLKNLLGVKFIEPASEKEIYEKLNTNIGSIGPVNCDLRIIVDLRVTKMKNFVTGANIDGFHYVNVNIGRDFKPSLVADLRNVREGDLCPKCGTPLQMKEGIELGHTFKLGTKYSEKMKATFLDREGKEQLYVMGCYGIGVGRTLQSVVEQHHDDKGIKWPVSISPFDIEILPLNYSDVETRDFADLLYTKLTKDGYETLLDDRTEATAGVKFNDADLIGCPIQIVIGRTFKTDNKIEMKIRQTGEKLRLSQDELGNFLKNYFEAAYKSLS